MLWLLLFVGICSVIRNTVGACPHQEPGLKPWSQASTWPHNRKPYAQSTVTISTPILLDEQPPELDSIWITRTGRLVWSPSVNITLKLKYIYIDGRMDIGSESCLYTGPAHIILKGQRGELPFKDHMGMTIGDKVILVAPGGTLEIHGQRKLPWTKLTRTLPRLTSKNGILFDHQHSNNTKTEEWEHGINAYIFNIDSQSHVTTKWFGSYELISPWQTQRERDRFIYLMQNLTAGDILMLSVHHGLDTGKDDNLTQVYDEFETLASGHVTGRSLLRTIKKYDAYTAIIQKGYEKGSFTEDLQPFHVMGDVLTASSSFLPPSTNVKVSAESIINSKHNWLNKVNFRVTTQQTAFPKLKVVDDTSTWRPGDRVVLTSTDYDWRQAEEATVVDCPDCTAHEVKVDLEAKFDHWGEIVNRVDERGEVALLTRNIVIEADVGPTCLPEYGNCDEFKIDTFGGHMKFLKDAIVHIEGAELYHMGQQTDAGRYPLHFHMGFDMRNMTHPPYLRENSIHHAFSRCITVHGTHGVLVRDNVCYNTLGHAFFIEDGGEHDTVFDGNLAASIQKGTLLPSDSRPAGFWITSPRTSMRNNVAAGGEGHGIWYIFPLEPEGPSRGLGFYQPGEADHTAITEFDNNVVHSNQESGLFFDKRLQPDGSAADGQFYFPKEDPLDEKSADKEVKIYRLTAYKNRIQNAWFRGGYFNVTESSLADSSKAITFARSSNQEQFMINSVIIGMSGNLGYPAENLTRSLPVWYDRQAPMQGFTFYDGPVYGHNIWFDGFVSTTEYKAGAIGYERLNDFASSPVSGVSNAKFGFVDGERTGNRIYDGDEGLRGFSRKDGDRVATSRDTDGSITGIRNAHIVKPWPFFVTPDCSYHSNWNMAICPHIYGKIVVRPGNQDKNKTFPIIVRDDLPTISETLTGVNANQFMVILGGSQTYTLHWSSYVPNNISIYVEGISKGQHVRVGVCLPRDATFDLFTYAPHYLPSLNNWVKALSLRDLDNSDGEKYFHDRTTGLLYFKFLNEFERLPNETKSCGNNRCPMVEIKNIHGNHADYDCRPRVYHATVQSDNRAITLQKDTKHLGVTMSHPPQNWGAGATKPFINRIPVHGGFGHWSDWGHCTVTCGGGHQDRTRACDSPVPAHGGKSCHGDYRQSKLCNSQHCPIDGGFTAWSQWTSCNKTTGCQGYKRRSRICGHPAPNYGGVYCQGSDNEIDACKVC